MSSCSEDTLRRRMGTAFGWTGGASLGVLLNYGLYLWVGPSYPTVPTTFGLFVVGAFGGLALADRLGPRGVVLLGSLAGVLLAAVLALGIMTLMAQ